MYRVIAANKELELTTLEIGIALSRRNNLSADVDVGSESQPGRDAHLAVRRVVDMRISGYADEPSPPIHVHAGRPGFDHQVVVSVTLLMHEIQSQAPVFGKMAPEEQMGVSLARPQTVVADGVR